ncbi:MAG: copper resistance CopC family protein [Tateyamaria sp.]|uniref:copper resistance CopC family protein n=1 Tax=Alphaproteobacteria TaxID=28211 RepID=UPI0032644B11
MKTIILAGCVGVLLATNAWAHSSVEKSTPANGATVASVEAVELRFDDPMRVTAISMTGPDGQVEFERETGMDAVTEFRALPPNVLPSGNYSVDWRGLSEDGHPMQGTFTFTVSD